MASTSFGGFTALGEETETAARMLLLPTMTGGGGFIGDIPRGGLGEEAVDRLLTLSEAIRFRLGPICGSFIVRAKNQAIEVPSLFRLI